MAGNSSQKKSSQKKSSQKKSSQKKSSQKKSSQKKSSQKKSPKGKTYYIHDNGGRPYKVTIAGKKVEIYTQKDLDVYSPVPFKIYYPQKIFIGKSPLNKMTESSGGHGPKFTGNSILLCMNAIDYIYIGWKIYSFRAPSPIKKFVSPVGNNDVPYPYAIDEENRYYFFIQNSYVNSIPKEYKSDPYDYLYNVSTEEERNKIHGKKVIHKMI